MPKGPNSTPGSAPKRQGPGAAPRSTPSRKVPTLKRSGGANASRPGGSGSKAIGKGY